MPAKKGGGKKGAAVSGSSKAGLLFPVGRMNRYLKKGLFARRVGSSAGVYIAAILQYVMEDILECAAGELDKRNQSLKNGKQQLSPRHLQLGIRNDAELSQLFARCSINMGGIVPHKNLYKKDQGGKMGGTQTM